VTIATILVVTYYYEYISYTNCDIKEEEFFKMASKAKQQQPQQPEPPKPTGNPNPSIKMINGGMNGDASKSPTPFDDRPMTPTRLTRIEEKNALIGLNNRLAAIIDRNTKLEADNSKLTAQIKSVEEHLEVTTNTLKNTYDNENKELRKQLETAEKDKAKLGLSENNFKNALNEANNKLQKKEKDNNDLQKQLKDSENKTINTENELKKQKDENNKLIKQNQELKDENKKLQDENNKLRKQIEAELMGKVELENALKNKGEELHLKAQIHEQEVSVIRSTNQNKIQELGGKLQQEYEAKLEQAIKQLRDDCNNQIKHNKNEQNKLYQIKESDWKGQLDKLGNDLKSKSGELSSLLIKVEDYDNRLSNLDGERHTLVQKLKAADDKLKSTQARLNGDLNDMDKRIKQLQDEKNKLIFEYQDLMEVKVALDNEIATYRKLLEGEEERLAIFAELGKAKEQMDLEQQIITAL